MVYTQYTQLLTQAQHIFQSPSLDPVQLITVYDPLIVRYCHNDTYPFPPNVPLDFMLQLDTFFNYIVSLSYRWNSSLVASPFMNIILNDWANYIIDPNTNPLGPKYSLLSAHDSDVGYALALMNLPSIGDPPYASHLEFELWKQDNSYLIMIAVNGKYLELPSCGGVICEFNQWYNSLPLLTPQKWQTMCNS